MTSGSQFTQSKHKNVSKFTATPVNPNPITVYVLLCTLLKRSEQPPGYSTKLLFIIGVLSSVEEKRVS